MMETEIEYYINVHYEKETLELEKEYLIDSVRDMWYYLSNAEKDYVLTHNKDACILAGLDKQS